MQSRASTVEEYLSALPEDRRAAIAQLRKVILKNLDKDYAEGMQYGVIGYFVPHTVFPAGYHCNPALPLPFAAIASKKNYISLYLMGVYCGCNDDGSDGSPHARWFQEAWKQTGKKLDMGKACVRFKRIEDAALDVIGEAIRRIPAREYIAYYEQVLERNKVEAAARSAARKGAGSGRPQKPVSSAKSASRRTAKAV